MALEGPEDSGYASRKPRRGARDRGEQGRHQRSHGHYSRHRHYYGCGHYGYGFGFGFNPFRYSYGFSYPYYDYYAPYFYNSLYYGGHSYAGPDVYVGGGSSSDPAGKGALDLDVKPQQADVYLDGRLIGDADQFDGFPTYLWLEAGTYELAFYREGYETLYLQYTIYPGVIVDVDYRMRKGKAELPVPLEDPYPAETEPFDPLATSEPPAQLPPEDPGFARIAVTGSPADAAVYLDGHFVGTAAEVAELAAGLIVEPGEHVIEVVRPGFATERLPVEVAEGEKIALAVDLEAP